MTDWISWLDDMRKGKDFKPQELDEMEHFLRDDSRPVSDTWTHFLDKKETPEN